MAWFTEIVGLPSTSSSNGESCSNKVTIQPYNLYIELQIKTDQAVTNMWKETVPCNYH